MKKHSCGAIFYTIYKKKIYIILGKERGDWFPFKGIMEKNETMKQTAIREIMEETCSLIKIKENDISLDCSFSTCRKNYHIGLIYVQPDIITNFYKIRDTFNDKKFLEKTDIRMFSLFKISKYRFHQITKIPISFYWNFLQKKQMELYNNEVNNLLKKGK